MKTKLGQRIVIDEPTGIQNNTMRLYQREKIFSPSYYPYWCLIMNLIFGFSVSLILFLVLPVLALLIYIDSRGPIFYTQERLGYQGSTFRMYKFRSMQTDAAYAKHLSLTTQHDPRVTRIGRFLRATHLDELPQTINILRGEMSLIGPRPEMPEFASNLVNVLPQYRYRLNVKPGLTGWAQVMHHYGDTVQDEEIKLQYDLYYIANQSFQLDIRIILKTVVEVLFGHGR
jgi:lipopolysaccharide/colanic/teichoic acid biosynthesis glycosyltransferase